MRFSITIPAYKTRFLGECIDSVLAQTYTDFEVIILNDASPEPVKEIVGEYTDPRIRYYCNEQNVGAERLVDNWNRCLELAKGDFIICIGDDDRLMPDCLEQYSRLIDRYPQVDLFHARTFRIDEDGKVIAVSHAYAEYEQVYSFMLHRQCFGIQFIGDFCYRTSALRQLGGYHDMPLAWGTDDITAYLAAREHGIVNVGEPTFCYRTNRLSITCDGNVALKMQAVEKERKWYQEFVRDTLPQNLVEEMCREELLMRMNSYFTKKKAQLLAREVRHDKLSLLKWIGKRKRFGLSLSTFVLAIYYSKKQ